MTVFLNFSGKTFALSHEERLQNQLINLFQNFGLDHQKLIFHSNGKSLAEWQQIENNSTIYAAIPLLGGKGGYGAKLKNQGGKKVRPNDNRFSRDAQGRRIDYQMAQKEYTEFIKKQMQQDEKVQKQRQQFRVMQQTMKQGQSFMKLDKKYNQQVEAAQTKLTESIKIGKQRLLQKMRLQKIQSYGEEKQQKLHYNEELEEQEKKQKSPDRSTFEKQEKEQEKENKEIQLMEKPIKKVKFDEPIATKEKQLQKPSFVSAKDKLKSLFKK